VVVQVVGAVRTPGVYHCQPGELVFDALAKAGGVREDSALASLKLTDPLENGSRLYVPTKQEAAASTAAAGVQVSVTGAVKQPGVYTCRQGGIIADALAKAGGPSAHGYPDALNLAAPLTDGCRVYVPTDKEWKQASREERQRGLYPPTGKPPVTVQADPPEVAPFTISPVEPAKASAKGGSASGRKSLPSGKFSLNTATFDQLMSLPGIGEKTAQRILDYRASHGKFNDLSELLNISRIGPKTYEKIVQYLTL
jgi:competence protein ComEA